MKDIRKAGILSKIVNEERNMARRQRQNPILFGTNEHLLPREHDNLHQRREENMENDLRRIEGEL